MEFRIGNTQIAFNFWFFAVISIFASTNAGALAFYFALPIVLHESGHIVAAMICGAKIKSIRFTAFGVEIKKETAGLNLAGEISISAAGIAANLLAAIGLYLCAFQSMRVILLISANLAVAIFNLLPIGGLDGGELTRVLSEYFFRPRLAYVLSQIFSFVALVPLFAVSIYLLMRPERNFTLLILCGYLAADVIIKVRD